MVAGRGIDQLGGDADSVAGLAYASLNDILHAELSGHLGEIDFLTLKYERRVASDDEEGAEPGQLGGDVLSDAV